MVFGKFVPLISLVNAQDAFLSRHMEETIDGDVCTLPMATGNHRAFFTRWGFKAGVGCTTFIFGGGAPVNGNHFASEVDCQTACPLICDLPQVPGVGKAALKAWGWRKDWGVCTSFSWGGSPEGSNANRFNSKAECKSAARRCPYSRPSGCLGVPHTPVDNVCLNRHGTARPNGAKTNKGPRAVGGCQTCICQDGQLQCNAKPRFRKEIADMTQKEFEKFAKGINILKQSGDWVEIAWMHMSVSGAPGNPMVSHGNNRFLHWHRKYLYDLESLIQSAADSCKVTLPYWNWALDAGEAGADQVKVWGPDRYGALKFDRTVLPRQPQPMPVFAPFFCPEPLGGQPSSCCFAPTCGQPSNCGDPAGNCPAITTDCCERDPDSGAPLSDECWCNTEATAPAQWSGVIVLGQNPDGPAVDAVTDGLFGADSAFSQDPILRGWSGEAITTVSFATMQTDLELRAASVKKDVAAEFVINETQREQIFANFVPSFPGEQPEVILYAPTTGFVEMVENFYHNSMHCAVGGIMCGPLSPYDPIFFLHHAQVDKIWKDWQDQHLDVDSERDWARDESWAQMATHICPQAAPSDPMLGPIVNAADMEDSKDMTGPAQDGSVDYFERQTEFQCADDEYPDQWEAIQSCMAEITKHGKWHEVKRVTAGRDDTDDMCSEMNPSNLKHNQMWTDAMIEMGHMTDAEAAEILTMHRQDLEHLGGFGERKTTYAEYGSLSRCEKRMCMAITSGGHRDVRSKCKELQPACDIGSAQKQKKCKANWTWNKINPNPSL